VLAPRLVVVGQNGDVGTAKDLAPSREPWPACTAVMGRCECAVLREKVCLSLTLRDVHPSVGFLRQVLKEFGISVEKRLSTA
jgi:hypothetical protein